MNKPFVVYNPATGTILRTGTCPEEMLKLQCLPGELMLGAVIANDRSHKVVAGRVVALTTQERSAVELAQRPKRAHAISIRKLIAALGKQGIILQPEDITE